MLDNKNLMLTILLSTLVLIGWQYFFETPRLENISNKQKQEIVLKEQEVINNKTIEVDRSLAILSNNNERVVINNGRIKGSINLRGFRIDDLLLLDYKQDITENSDKVILLSPANTKQSFFAEFGWISDDKNLQLPGNDSLWQVENKVISDENSLIFFWRNSQNIIFNIIVHIDDNYMFTIKQLVKNESDKAINLSCYGLINKKFQEVPASQSILHEGYVGSSQKILYEEAYSNIKIKDVKQYSNNSRGDWLGITDKYWLTSIIPQGNFNTKILRAESEGNNIYQIDYIASLKHVPENNFIEDTLYFFAGAKNLKQLDKYSKLYAINLFDRAVDFGWFYFLTKPMFLSLQFLFMMTGNFGVAILLLTVLIKLFMYPLANKSYQSMNKMKALAPQLAKIKENYANDKMQLNKETMELYKREKINPVSGCLPLFLQIPVFFSLYKVLFVTIEMRHAPFFGWIQDLSAPDPTSIFNLFGLIKWLPPSFLMIGAWPIIMALTMYLQQTMSPEPSDPVQAKAMKFLPLIFVFMFGSFPAGLVIYWAWNNILSILQQWLINIKSENVK